MTIDNENFLNLFSRKLKISNVVLFKFYKNNNHNEYETIIELLKLKLVDRKTLGPVWAKYIGYTYVDIDKYIIDQTLTSLVPSDLLKEYKIIPLYKFGKSVTIATYKKLTPFVQDRLEKSLSCIISPVFSFHDQIDIKLNSLNIKKSDSEKSNQLQKEIEIEEVNDSSSFVETKKSDKKSKKTVTPNKQLLISTKAESFLVNNTKQVFNKIAEGKVPTKEQVQNISTKILTEITDKFDVKDCVHNLRVNDEYTYSHCINVGILSSIIGKIMNFKTSDLKDLTLGAILHDIGKMRIPKSILYKTTEYSEDELILIKRHSFLGYQLAQTMELSNVAAEIIYNHHELADNSGYPRGLSKHQISLNTKIVSIVNLYDNLVSDSPNQQAISKHEALNILMIEGKTLFDPDILAQFVKLAYKTDLQNLKRVFQNKLIQNLS